MAGEYWLHVHTIGKWKISDITDVTWQKSWFWFHQYYIQQQILWWCHYFKLHERRPPQYPSDHIQGPAAWNGASISLKFFLVQNRLMYWCNWHPGCIMNFITHNRAFSIHPQATFIEQWSLVYDLSPKSFKVHMKYVFCGWNKVQYPQATDYADPLSSFGRGPRRIGDRKC